MKHHFCCQDRARVMVHLHSRMEATRHNGGNPDTSVKTRTWQTLRVIHHEELRHQIMLCFSSVVFTLHSLEPMYSPWFIMRRHCKLLHPNPLLSRTLDTNSATKRIQRKNGARHLPHSYTMLMVCTLSSHSTCEEGMKEEEKPYNPGPSIPRLLSPPTKE